mgnify:CR=1 FL=1
MRWPSLGPSFTFATVTVFSGTDHVDERPGAPRWIAETGTISVSCIVLTRSRTLTNWLGNRPRRDCRTPRGA